MNHHVARDVEYHHDHTRMIGHLTAPAGAVSGPTVLLVHDAFGVSDEMLAVARRLVDLGLAVFLADVWGERTLPRSEPEIGPLIGAMVSDRVRWMGRVAAAHEAAAAQPEVDGGSVVVLGYCFGGSSALEYARTGHQVAGVVSIHAGLDLLGNDWSAATGTAPVLVCTGADDPMATAALRDELTTVLDGAGVDWELDLYSGTKHAFTSPHAAHSPNPDAVAHHPRNAARAWESTTRFLTEIFPDLRPARA